MKKLFAHFMLFALAGTLFSSCSNSSKLAITKRHYRSGYYVNFGSGNHTAAVASVPKVPVRVKHQITTLAPAKSENYVAVSTPTAISRNVEVTQMIAAPKKVQESSSVLTTIYASQSTSSLNAKVTSDAAGQSGGGGHDRVATVPFVVIVLCAIFIPPLGVGLMYGINSYFWIDLILTLLFFFPGMIFAIIVVLM